MEIAIKTIKSLQIGVGWLPEEKGNGLDRVFYALTRNLPEAGVDVRGLVVGSSNVASDSENTVLSFAAKDESLRRRIGLLRSTLRDELRSNDFDVIASHFALFTYPVLKYIKDHPLVVHFHGPWSSESEAEGEGRLAVKAKWALERSVYKSAKRFIVLSDAFRDLLIENYRIDPGLIRKVQGGVQANRFDTGLSMMEARDRLGWPTDRPIVFVVRRLARRMGLENLIAAMVQVRREQPDALLHIAGSGPIRAELEDRIRAAELQDHVKLLGFVPDEDLPLAYRAANFSIVPTVALEGFGLITVESMAAGTPVLVTNVGGLPETVKDLSEDLILPDAEVKTLGNYVLDALAGRLTLPSSEACQAYVRERFDWPVIARQVRDVYAEVVS